MDSLSNIKILEFNSSSSPTLDDSIKSEPVYLIKWEKQTEDYCDKKYEVLYKAIKYKQGGSFSALYTQYSNTVQLAYGEIFLDPPEIHGHYIGTYLFNETVKWAKKFTDAKVLPIHIRDVDDNVKRRRRFYEQFGLKIVEDGNGNAHTLEMNVNELKEQFLPDEKVKEYELVDFIHDLLSNKKANELEIEFLNQRINNCHNYYKENYKLKRQNFFVKMYYRYLR
ncbi:MAG: hypothetical protein II929_04695 [Succinivibrio sp.]|nr:hypothetical protein [Succinivibrio sp.]